VQELPDWEPDLIVVLDCSDRQRLAYLYSDSLFERILSVNIDHHATNEHFATVNWVDPSMAATTEMLAALLAEMDWPLDETVATCLLTGLHTDSLGFRTPTTQPRTLRLAADLMIAGASMTDIVGRIYDSKPRATLRIWGLALADIQEEGPLVWTTITQDMLARAGAENENLNGIVGFMRSTADVEVAVLFSETTDGRVRTEFRSKGRVNVAEIAYRLGGGGHAPAAGCSLPGPLEEAVRTVLAEVRQALAASGL
jgi:phosphoesterase RecJ-like protein